VAGVRSTNFQVARLKRDIFRKSSLGVIMTGRSVGQHADEARQSVGVDTTLAFYNNVVFDAYWAKTPNPASGDDDSYRGRFEYSGDRYGVLAEHMKIGKAFFPEVGFVRRADVKRSLGQIRFSPRPNRSPIVRKYSWIGTIDYFENGAGRVDTRNAEGQFGIDFQNGDTASVAYTSMYEFLPAALRLAPGVIVPAGGYHYASVLGTYVFGAQRTLASGSVSLESGSFYDGHKTSLTIARARSNFPPHLYVEPSYSVNMIDLPQGKFTTNLIGSRITYMVTPLMFTSALVQYNSVSHSVSTNIRFRWEYQPGSELFIVYNDQRDTVPSERTSLANRVFIVKINRLFRF
jgi:hypothetical protein